MNRSAHARGFTLVEAIAVIVITGIIASMVTVFMLKPVARLLQQHCPARHGRYRGHRAAPHRARRPSRPAQHREGRRDRDVSRVHADQDRRPLRATTTPASSSPGCTSLSTMGDMLEQRSDRRRLGPGLDLQSVQQQRHRQRLQLVDHRAVQRVLRERSRYPRLGHRRGSSSNTLGFALTRVRATGRLAYAQGFYHFGLARHLCLRRGDRHPVAHFRVCAGSPCSRSAWSRPPLLDATRPTSRGCRSPTNVTCPTIATGAPPRFSYASGASERYSLLSAWITLTKQR